MLRPSSSAESLGFYLVDLPVAGIKKILLPQVRCRRAHIGGYVGMIVDHQPHAGIGRDWGQALGQVGDVIDWPILGAKLHEIRTTVAELAAQHLRVAAIEIGRVHERIQ
ncbi:MAG: hypothetical protein CM1200mP29_13120 [Verrucomicrobiota bacterium]|nr:MAG: hypothetical protein CM1200mP29_13120 [Verrucomicrobiota bacterium]